MSVIDNNSRVPHNPSRFNCAVSFLKLLREERKKKRFKFHNKTWLCNRSIAPNVTSLMNKKKKSKTIKNYVQKNIIVHLKKTTSNSQEDILRSFTSKRNIIIVKFYNLFIKQNERKVHYSLNASYVSVFFMLRFENTLENHFKILHLKSLLHI